MYEKPARDRRSSAERRTSGTGGKAWREADSAAQLLQLQQAGGNRAVTRLLQRRLAPEAAGVIQRSKLKRSDIRSNVSWAMRDGGNLQSVLLKIYNSIAIDSGVPQTFSSIPAATKALKDAEKIDDDDIEALREAVQLSLSSGEDRSRLVEEKDMEKLEEKKPGVRGKYHHHLFHGDFDKDGFPTGYHSKQVASATHQAYGTQTPVGNGVYQQSVRGRKSPTDDWTKKKQQSTFFPDTATEDDIITAIASVAELKYKTVQYPVSLRGLTLVKKGNTYFPAGGTDKLAPE